MTKQLLTGWLTAALLATAGMGVHAGAAEPGQRMELLTRRASAAPATIRQMAALDSGRSGAGGRGPQVREVPLHEQRDFRRPVEDGTGFTPPPLGGGRTGKGASASAPQRVGARGQATNLNDTIGRFGVGSIPPATMGAVGPNHFVELLNSSATIFAKNGTRLSRVTLDSFFTFNSGGVNYPRNGALLPRVLFDRDSSRWFACAQEIGEGVGSNNHILLAVSRTSDPTGTWDRYVLPVGVPSSGSNTFFTSFPTLGTDTNGVYVGVTIVVSNGTAKSYRAKIVATPKAPLLATSPSLGAVFQTDNVTDMWSSPQPATSLDATGAGDPAYFVASSATVLANVAYRTVTWSGETPVISSTKTATSPGYAAHGNAPATGSTTPIHTGDDRLLMAMLRNGSVWTCRNVGVNSSGGGSGADRTGCEWLQLNASGGMLTLAQSGRVFDPASTDPFFFYFPSLAVSGQGHVAMGFSGSNSTVGVGAYTCGRLVSDPPGTMQAVLRLIGSLSTYNRLDSAGLNRWGDYSYTSVDPVDDQTMWTIQEYTATQDNWGTWVAELLAPPPAVLGATGSAPAGSNSVVLSVTGTGFFEPGPGIPKRARAELNGGSPNGITVTAVTVHSDTNVRLTLSIALDASVGSRNVTFVNPDGQAHTILGTFTVLPPKVSLSGTVTASTGGGLAGVMITAGGATTTTAADGTYTFAELSLGEVTVTPSLTRWSFNPPARTLTLSANTTGVDFTAVPDPPAAPSNLAATPGASGRVGVTWQDNSGDETGFKLERSPDGTSFAQIASLPAGATTFEDSGLAANSTYTYRVRATGAGGDSAFSNTDDSLTLPAAPTGLIVSTPLPPDGSTHLDLNWTDASPSPATTVLERALGDGSFVEIATLDAVTRSYRDGGLSPGTRYRYRLKARNASGESDFTAAAEGTTLPELVSLTLSKASVKSRKSVTATVTLSGPAPAGGLTVALTSSSLSAIVPASVTVPAGSTTAKATVRTKKVRRTTTATLDAMLGSTLVSATLRILK